MDAPRAPSASFDSPNRTRKSRTTTSTYREKLLNIGHAIRVLEDRSLSEMQREKGIEKSKAKGLRRAADLEKAKVKNLEEEIRWVGRSEPEAESAEPEPEPKLNPKLNLNLETKLGINPRKVGRKWRT